MWQAMRNRLRSKLNHVALVAPRYVEVRFRRHRRMLLSVRGSLLWKRQCVRGPSVKNRVGARLHLLPEDVRAHLLWLNRGTNAPVLNGMWGKLVKVNAPDLVVDVGANYGEVICSTKAYPPDATLLAVEPNPGIAEKLERTLREFVHEVELVVAAASDNSEPAWLYFNSEWSGTATVSEFRHEDPQPVDSTSADHLPPEQRGPVAWRREFASPTQAVQVPCVRLDDVVSGNYERILVKIDVEGHELAVLKGFKEHLDAASRVGVLLEVSHLSYQDLLWLERNFQIHVIDKYRRCLVPATAQFVYDVQQPNGRLGNYLRSDAVLLKKEGSDGRDDAPRLGGRPPWRVFRKLEYYARGV